MTKNILYIHHSSLLVKNTQASLKFYCGVLGLQELERPNLPYGGGVAGFRRATIAFIRT